MKRSLRWLPVIIWMGVIFFLSSRTGSELGSMFPWVNRYFNWLDGFNFGHFIAYFVLSICFLLALRRTTIRAKLLVFVLCVVYGATDEYHQRFVEGRSPDWLDLRNDAIGASLAMLAISIPPVARLWRRWLA